MRRAGAVRKKEINEWSLVFLGDTLKVEDFAEVGVGAVADVNEVCLYESFGWEGADLQSLEKGVDLGHGLINAFDEAMLMSDRDRRG